MTFREKLKIFFRGFMLGLDPTQIFPRTSIRRSRAARADQLSVWEAVGQDMWRALGHLPSEKLYACNRCGHVQTSAVQCAYCGWGDLYDHQDQR